MRTVDKTEFKTLLRKGDQHQKSGLWSYEQKDFDAAITNLCIALINYLDALSVNRFGKDLSSDGHEGAPAILLKQLGGIGITDFKTLSKECVSVLKLKSAASYRSEELTAKDARSARVTVEKARAYVRSKLDPDI